MSCSLWWKVASVAGPHWEVACTPILDPCMALSKQPPKISVWGWDVAFPQPSSDSVTAKEPKVYKILCPWQQLEDDPLSTEVTIVYCLWKYLQYEWEATSSAMERESSHELLLMPQLASWFIWVFMSPQLGGTVLLLLLFTWKPFVLLSGLSWLATLPWWGFLGRSLLKHLSSWLDELGVAWLASFSWDRLYFQHLMTLTFFF